MRKNLEPLEKKEYIYYITLLSSCVNQTAPPLPYDGISWQNIYRISTLTRTQAMLADAVLKLPDEAKPDESIIKKLSDIKNQSIYLDGISEFEIEKVLSQFEKHKIKNAPVKGYFMKKEYPHSFYRSISDYDILFDTSQLDAVKQAFSKLGYEYVKYDEQQYHFRKKPFVYVEMHEALIDGTAQCYPQLANQLDRAVLREGYEFSRQLTPEDHYTYLVIHASKHYRRCGMGLKMVLDIYLYYKNHSAEFDMSYLERHLKNCGVDIFEKRLREIAFKWFSPSAQITDFDDVESYIILSCALGRKDVLIMVSTERGRQQNSSAKKKSRLRSFFSAACPGRRVMEHNYPCLKKFPFLLPFTWVHKWFHRYFIDKNVRLKDGLNGLKYNDSDVEYYKAIQAEMGFDAFDM